MKTGKRKTLVQRETSAATFVLKATKGAVLTLLCGILAFGGSPVRADAEDMEEILFAAPVEMFCYRNENVLVGVRLLQLEQQRDVSGNLIGWMIRYQYRDTECPIEITDAAGTKLFEVADINRCNAVCPDILHEVPQDAQRFFAPVADAGRARFQPRP